MGLRTKSRSNVPIEVLVEHVTAGTVTPWEFRVYYADGSYDPFSYRIKTQLVVALETWLDAEGFDVAVMEKMPGSTGDWEWSIKLKYT